MGPTRNAILSLYRNLIQESKKWNSYNYRMYALRKIRHEFKENKTLTDEEKVRQCYTKGLETLSMIKKQVVLGDLYSTRPLIIETKSKLNTTQ
ncbi:LYR motif-containing protein 4 [Trachymyrmex zeteki]|uniref:LYR motif-containing protein 4 n=1 Tax=Mycetomoellerius zeteki TaxID=64791 RepID=A0A151X3C2_9HYME|nr:PREDICTED: LYR motif-containing protein 4B [Trachymyrmex zeteki]KYQ54779.1 LYR motif-containing protein 4 [Trachymyrmex zeteki]